MPKLGNYTGYKPASTEDILHLFFDLDKNRQGSVSVREVINAAQTGKLGALHHKNASVKYIYEMDMNKDGNITVQEFFQGIRQREKVMGNAFKFYQLGNKEELDKLTSEIFGRPFTLQESSDFIGQMLEYHRKIPMINAQRGQGQQKRRFAYQPMSTDEIVELFTLLDTDGNGVLSPSEIIQHAQEGALGILHSRNACMKFLEEADVNADGVITVSEFLTFIRKREVVLAGLFWHMDQFDEGRVDAERVRKYVAKVVGRDMTLEEATAFVAELDSKHNGSFDVDDLVRGALFTTGEGADIFKGWKNAAAYLFDDGAPLSTSGLTNFLAGIAAGATRCTATAPFDRISIVMRAGTSAHTANNAGPLEVAKSLIRTGGVRGLWKGNGVMCAGYGPEGAAQLFFMNHLKDLMQKDPTNPTPLEKFLTAGTAGWMAMTLFYPNYIQQARMAFAEKGRFDNFLDMVQKTMRLDGPRQALFGGYGACSLRRFPEIGINYATYQVLKDRFAGPGKDPSIAQSLLFGATAGFIRCSVVFPLCSVQVKLMLQGESMGRPVVYSGVLDCFSKTIYGCEALGLKPQGVRGLYRGWSAYMMKMVPAIGIEMASIEFFMKFFAQYTG